MDPFAVKEAINRRLRHSRLAREQFLGKTIRSEYQSGICGAVGVQVWQFWRPFLRPRQTANGDCGLRRRFIDAGLVTIDLQQD